MAAVPQVEEPFTLLVKMIAKSKGGVQNCTVTMLGNTFVNTSTKSFTSKKYVRYPEQWRSAMMDIDFIGCICKTSTMTTLIAEVSFWCENQDGVRNPENGALSRLQTESVN